MYEPDATIDISTLGGPVTLAVDDRGGGDALPLVLIHGFTGGRIDFADVIDTLAADRRVVAWDHRGHSDSTNTGDGTTYRFDVLAADAVAAIDALGIDRFHLLGHSMGGIVAQLVTLEHAERVASLILMDTLAEPSGEGIPQAWIDRTVTLGRTEGMAAVAEMMASFSAGTSVAAPEDQPRIAERNRHKLTHMDVEAFAALGEQLRSFDALLGRLSEITCPTTVMVGELDKPLLEQADRIAAAVPGATHVVIDGAAHCPQEERPQAWLDAVHAHLSRAAN